MNSILYPASVQVVGVARFVHTITAPAIGSTWALDGRIIKTDPFDGIGCMILNYILMITLSPTVKTAFDRVTTTLPDGRIAGFALYVRPVFV